MAASPERLERRRAMIHELAVRDSKEHPRLTVPTRSREERRAILDLTSLDRLTGTIDRAIASHARPAEKPIPVVSQPRSGRIR